MTGYTCSNPSRYLTLDRWQSEQHYDASRTAFAKEYEALDADCQELTNRESTLGAYRER